MAKKIINDQIQIRNTSLKNRIVFPPMVISPFTNESGLVSDQHVQHYRAAAKGGAGLIIQEATCISATGKLAQKQLGIWDDAQIDGLMKITDAVHQEHCPIIVQIHHAGIVGIAEQAVCPSAYALSDPNGRVKIGAALSIHDIHQLQDEFVQAAIRAYKAGYDGVELHGCHRYLISQFLNSRVNRRNDQYGTNPLLFVSDILASIRAATPEDFIVGIRIGGLEPTLEEGIQHAQLLESYGIDFLNVSSGFSEECDEPVLKDFPFDFRIYAAGEIKKQVSVPVFGVFGIRTLTAAQQVLDLTNIDMVNIGRSQLVDYDWANKSMSGEVPGICIGCKTCTWASDPTTCAGRRIMLKGKQDESINQVTT